MQGEENEKHTRGKEAKKKVWMKKIKTKGTLDEENRKHTHTRKGKEISLDGKSKGWKDVG